jgi:MFS family permease
LSPSPALPAPVAQQDTDVDGAGRTQLGLLLAGSCMPVLGATLLSPLLSRISQHFAGTPGVSVLVPLVLAIPALLIALAAPFAGRIADRLDRKRLLVAAMVAYSVFGTAPLYLTSLKAVLVSRILVGVCEAAIMTCCTTLIGDYWTGQRRRRYLGLQTLAATVAATVFVLLGGALGNGDWRTPFWVYAVAAALAVPMAVLLPQPAARAAEARRNSRTPAPWRQVALPAAVSVFGGAVFYALLVQLSYVLDDAGVKSSAAVGGVTGLMSLATAVGAALFAKLIRRGHGALLTAEFALAGLGLLLVFATAAVPVIALGAVLTGLATGALLPTLLTWAVEGLSYEQRGRGTGLWTAALFLGEFLSPLIVSALGAGLGGLRPALAALGVAALAVAALARTVLRVTDARTRVDVRAPAVAVE